MTTLLVGWTVAAALAAEPPKAKKKAKQKPAVELHTADGKFVYLDDLMCNGRGLPSPKGSLLATGCSTNDDILSFSLITGDETSERIPFAEIRSMEFKFVKLYADGGQTSGAFEVVLARRGKPKLKGLWVGSGFWGHRAGGLGQSYLWDLDGSEAKAKTLWKIVLNEPIGPPKGSFRDLWKE